MNTDYQNWSKELEQLAFAGGAWFRFPKRLLHSDLKLTEVILLAWLINEQVRVRVTCQNRQTPFDGWLRCRTGKIHSELGFEKSHQMKLFKALKDAGLIEQAKQGNGQSRRLVRLLPGRIEALLTAEQGWTASTP